MSCPPEMTARKAKLEKANQAFLRLKARFTLTPDRTADLDTSARYGREFGTGLNKKACYYLGGERVLDDLTQFVAGGQ